ncbi:WG repeat-containing protein [Micromonospora luteifusca]|uniref:WG repeat-containing protein n=1 Tax=Micromonospora luteifusca TaxID=709860 RepID=UPI0033BFB188
MSGRYNDPWPDPNEPSWVVEPTTEWHPQFPGQRYPGDIGMLHQPPPPRGRATVTGRAEVPPLAPTRPDGTYLGRSWADEPPAEPAPHSRSWVDDEPGETPNYGRPRSDERPTDASSLGRPDSADSRHYDHEPYRRPLPEPPRRDDRRSPESDRRTAWSDRRPADERGPAREAAWHRDQPTSERYDSRRPRQEPTEWDRGHPGTRPVSPAPRSDSGRVLEPDDAPRRRGTQERPAAGYERHPGDGYGVRPTRDHDGRMADDRVSDAADPWAPVDGGTRYRADGYPDRAADDVRRPERRYRPDEGAGAAPPPNGGRRPEPEMPEQPRRDDERRRPDPDPHRQQPRESAARAEAYPDRRPREEVRPDAYREDGRRENVYREDRPRDNGHREDRPRDNGHREDRPRDNGHREPRPQPGQRPDGGLPWPPPGPLRPDRSRESDRRTEPHRTADPHRIPEPHRTPDPHRSAEPVVPPRPAARPERPAATPSRYDDRPVRPAATAPPAPATAGRAVPVPPVTPERPVPPVTPERPVSSAPVSPAAPGRDRPVSAAPVSPAADVPISGPPAARLRLEYLPAPVDPPIADESSDAPSAGRRTPTEAAPAAGAHPTPPPRYHGPDNGDRPVDHRRGGEPIPDRHRVGGTPGTTAPSDHRPASPERPHSPERADLTAEARPAVAPPPTWQVPDPSSPRPTPTSPGAATPTSAAPTSAAPTSVAPTSAAPGSASAAPASAAPEPLVEDAGVALPLAPGTPRRYVPPPPSEGPVAPVRASEGVPGTRGPDAWFSPAQPAETDQGEPATDRQSADFTDDESTAGDPGLSTSLTTVDTDPSTPTVDVHRDQVDEPTDRSAPTDVPAPLARPTSSAPSAWADDPVDDAPATVEPGSVEGDRPISGVPAIALPHHQAEAATEADHQPAAARPVGDDADPTEHDPTDDAEPHNRPPDAEDIPATAGPTDDAEPHDRPSDVERDPSTAGPTDDWQADDWPIDAGPPAQPVTSDDDTYPPVAAAPVSTPPVSDNPAPGVPAPAAAPISAPPAPALPAAAEPISAPPASAQPASVTPVSAPPSAAAPVSAPPTTPVRDFAAPVSAAPVSAPPAPAEPAAVAPVSVPPLSTPPLSTPPAAAPPPPATPISAPPTSPAPVSSAAPVSAPPISAPPASAMPTSAPPASAMPTSGPPASTVPGPRTGSGGENVPVSAPPGDALPTAARPSLADPGDPEQVLAAYRWRLDPVTLREELTEPDDLRAIRRRLTEKLGSAIDNRARARLLSLRAVTSRILGDLDDALADGRLALTYAEATGELRRTALAQARLAHVLRWRGSFAEADQLFAQANSVELPDRLRAALHEHAGRSCYDQGRLMEACQHFEQALDLRGAGDAELLDRIRVALDAVTARATTDGFGPYRRGRDEVLDRDRPPLPERDGPLWGYTSQDGDLVIPARYAEAQPFHDGLAWVRRPDTDRWSLINLLGTTVIPPSFRAAHPFSDGLAWVVGEGGWTAIDATGAVHVAPNFAEVRPFRRGLAAVRREGWGAVDRTGRIVVPTRYHGFVTELADGQQVDGFTDEGLAVVDVAGRRGVVDRTGAVLVPPTHAMLAIHPVAFLVASGTGRWGALDRRGAALIDLVHRDRAEVLTEIDRLLTDANPVL